jgi:phosphoribosylaminoimidazole-succinocarboxamide synthase
MIPRSEVEAQLSFSLENIDLNAVGEKIEGKVRDCYVVDDKRILIASDRLSAFDVVLTSIPFKGQVLTQMAMHWFEETKHIIPNHIISNPHPNVMVSQEVSILPIEVVVRGYITGSAWRDYSAGKAVSGIRLEPGLKKSQKFDTPILTPSTKADRGEHDEPISEEEILKQGIVEESVWAQVREKALELFAFGTKKAAERGLILVDTKYEFGQAKDGTLILADEVHTPDSSRYWLLESYQSRFEAGEDPEMFDKEFVRRALIEQGYMGEGTPPELSDEFRVDTSLKYIDAYERITGKSFTAEVGSSVEGIRSAVEKSLQNS